MVLCRYIQMMTAFLKNIYNTNRLIHFINPQMLNLRPQHECIILLPTNYIFIIAYFQILLTEKG